MVGGRGFGFGFGLFGRIIVANDVGRRDNSFLCFH